MTSLRCPSCGSENVSVQNVTEKKQLTLGPEFSYDVPIHVCASCGEEWDLKGEGDAYREQALDIARKELAGILIEDIQNKGLKLSYVERALELPQRTISSKWRIGISASGLALLRIISSMPWIVNIADNKFSSGAIGREIAKVLVDNGATIETVIGIENGINIKVTTAPDQYSIVTNQMFLSTGT